MSSISEEVQCDPDGPRKETSLDQGISMSGAAISGSAWGTVQSILSRAMALVSSYVFARLMSADDYAASAWALGVSTYLVLLIPGSMTDLLVSNCRNDHRAVWSYRSKILWIGAVMSGLVLAAIPIAGFIYGNLWAIATTLGVLSLRNFFDAVSAVPTASLRLQLRFRELAVCDLWATVVGAATGLGLAVPFRAPWVLLVPILGASVVRYYLLRYKTSGSRMGVGREFGLRNNWLKDFFVSGMGQYVHGMVARSDLLVIGILCSNAELGMYAFALNLAFQAQALLLSQIAAMLQPVLAMIGHDAVRQAEAYRRTLSMLSAVLIPAAVIQATLARPIYDLLFPSVWADSIPAFIAMSFLMAVVASAGPMMALMRARESFGLFTRWQTIHLIIALPTMAIAGLVAPRIYQATGHLVTDYVPSGQAAPVAVALANGLVWACSLGWASRRIEHTNGSAARFRLSIAQIYLRYLVACAAGVASYVCYAAIKLTLPFPWSHLVCLGLVAPILLVLSLTCIAAREPRLREDAMGVIRAVRNRLRLTNPQMPSTK